MQIKIFRDGQRADSTPMLQASVPSHATWSWYAAPDEAILDGERLYTRVQLAAMFVSSARDGSDFQCNGISLGAKNEEERTESLKQIAKRLFLKE